MKTLQDILYKVALIEMRGDSSCEVRDFHFDSREVGEGDLFVAVLGTAVDGHDYIDKAVAQGAAAVVCERIPDNADEAVTWVQVAESRAALAYIAANYFDNPAEELDMVGVTGTNGKTTIATLLYRLFNAMGEKSGLLSTVNIRIGEELLPSTHTTPDPKGLHKALRRMADSGCSHCFMEVSSHALAQGRVEGIDFSGAIFTNITHDHLDYHADFKDYLNAKKKLFDQLPSEAFALTNVDDRNGMVMLQNTKARRLGYGIRRDADYKCRLVENTLEGLLLEIGGKEVWFRMLGSFNAYNLLAVYATACELGFESEEVLLELSRIEGVDGRFQTVQDQGVPFTAIVDYAHTPDALKNVLQTVRDIRTGDTKVITVVGCGGNRDKDKRPIMGQIAAELSDHAVFTSDNPRNEEPGQIIREMEAGVPASMRRKVLSVENRREAIRVACQLASEGDVVLVAGKGHETYQEIQGVKHPFDDREVLRETFNALNA